MTLAGNSEKPVKDRVRDMLNAFSRFGVNDKHITRYLNKSLDEVLPEDIADLQGVFNSLKSGQHSAKDFFGMAPSGGESKSVSSLIGDEQQPMDNEQSAAGIFGSEQ